LRESCSQNESVPNFSFLIISSASATANTSPKSHGVNATGKAFSHNQDPRRTCFRYASFAS
jgi:hypothetical protein